MKTDYNKLVYQTIAREGSVSDVELHLKDVILENHTKPARVVFVNFLKASKEDGKMRFRFQTIPLLFPHTKEGKKESKRVFEDLKEVVKKFPSGKKYRDSLK